MAVQFKPIFDKGIRESLTSLSMTMGGVKELYENIYRISCHRYSKLTEIYESGWSTLEMSGEDNTNRMSCLKETLSNIRILIVSADLNHFIKYIAKQDYSSIYQTRIITVLKNSFANEISFLFYIFLARKAETWPESQDERTMPSSMYESMMHIDYLYRQEKNARPKDFLLCILKRDHEIKDRFIQWMEDSIIYEGQIIDHMRQLQDEI